MTNALRSLHGEDETTKKGLDAATQTGHGRTLSFPSTGDHGNSEFEAQDGTLRIVINRPTERQPKTANNAVQPTLEVPIPHYRIGTPRFSTQGTPILRSSAYSRISESASTNIKASISQKPKLLFPVRHSSYVRDPDTRPISDVLAHTGQRLAEAQARQSTNLASPSAAPIPGTTISLAKLSTGALQLFADLVIIASHGAETQGNSTGPSIEQQHERLALWASNLGATHLGHSSLDYRLREADLVRNAIGTFLKDLCESLLECEIYHHNLRVVPNICNR
jgi:hypothetical protein